LNVGVGGGAFEEIGLEIGLDVFSLDPDAESIARLNRRPESNEKAKVGYLQSVPFASGQFDVVVVSEVLEHLSDEVLQKSIDEIHRVLSPGGLVAGTVPAREVLSEQLVVCPYCGEKFHRKGHLQSFGEQKLNDLLSRRFEIQEIHERYLDDWWRLNWKGKTISLIKRSLLFLGVRGSNNSLYFSAIRR
jgi:SAM-dependent methyltransferase